MVKLFRGCMMGRAALALARAKGDREQAAMLAAMEQPRWGSLPADYLKAATPPGTRSTWNPLVAEGEAEFIELVQQQSLLGRIPFRSIPANLRLVAVTGRGAAGFVAEGTPKPVTVPALEALGTASPSKCLGMTVVTDEVVRAGGIAVEHLVTDTLAGAVALAIDQKLTDPSNAGAGPPALGHNTTPIAGSGDLAADIVAALGQLTSTARVVIVMNPLDAAQAAAQRASSGAPLDPDLGPRGGSVLTIPVFTSDGAPRGVINVLDPTRIGVYQGAVEIKFSNQATVALNTAPDDSTNSSTVMTSLWQANLHGLLVEEYVSWLLPSVGAVAVITGETFTAPT